MMMRRDRFVAVTRSDLAALVAAVAVALGLSYRLARLVPAPMQPGYWLVPTALLMAIVGLCLFAAVKRPAAVAAAAAAARAGVTGFAVLLVSAAATVYASYPIVPAAAGLGMLLALACLVGLRYGRRRSEGAVVGVAAAWSVAVILSGNYATIGGDLLPIVVAAGRNLLHGIDPYTADYAGITNNPFFYMPLQWLAFVPAVAVGVDPRVVNAILVVAAAMLLWRTRRRGTATDGVVLLCLAFVFSCSAVRAASRTYVIPYWFLCALFVRCFVAGRDVAAAFLIGCLLLTRQTFMFDAAALLVGLARRMEVRRLAALCGVAAATAAVGAMPFIVWHPTFLYQVFVEGPRRAIAMNAGNPIATAQVGLVPLARAAGLSLPPFAIQGACVAAGLLAIFLRNTESRTQLALAAGAIDLLGALSGAQTFEYYWGSGLTIVLAALLFAA